MICFFGYFDPVNIFFIININNFRGDLSDISAKTATLVVTSILCLYAFCVHQITVSVFVQELEKLHSYEEKLQGFIDKEALDHGIPAISVHELPTQMDLNSQFALTDQEAKWCIDTADAKSADMLKNDKMITEPYGSAQFKELLTKNAERQGIAASQVDAVWQKEGKLLGFV